MDLVIEVLVKGTTDSSAERMIGPVVDLIAGNGFKQSREDFAASANAHAALAQITNGQARVRVCKVGE